MHILSYNLRKNTALSELNQLSVNKNLDAMCIQEADIQHLPKNINNLELVKHTDDNRLGLAVYLDTEKYDVIDAKTFKLKKSLHDILLTPAHERLLGVHAVERKTNQDFSLASFHAAPLTALNSLRRDQIKSGLENLKKFGNQPIMMIGDFNYPVFQRRLTEEMKKQGYDLSLSDQNTYLRYKIFKGHYDFVTSQGFLINSVKTLKQGLSDHLPILVHAQQTV